MLLLTWHATILRVEQAQNRLIHTQLVPARPTARDYVHAPESETRLVPAAGHANAAHLVSGEMMLAVRQDAHFPVFESVQPGPEHTVLALDEAEVALLRALLSGPWRHAERGEDLEAGALEPGFVLVIGPHRIDLAEARPAAGAGGSVHLPGGAGTLLPMPRPRHAGEIALVPADASVPRVDDPAAFAALPAATLEIAGEHLAFLPITGSLAARDWLYRAGGAPPPTGRQDCRVRVQHQQEAWVLAAGADGPVIFGEHGLLHGPSVPPGRLPAGFSREADVAYAARAALAAAPRLAGAHLLAGAGALLECVVQLCLLRPHAPKEAGLLVSALPARAAAARDTWLALLGLGERAQTSLDATPLCRVDDLFWTSVDSLDDVPAAALQAVRDRAHAALPAETPVRFYITEGLANAAMARTAAANQGFSVLAAEKLSAAAVAAQFRNAAFIVAPHGPVLENLLFCAAGTRVIELAPETGWEPRYGVLAGKLGLVHAVLPCKLLEGLPRPEMPALAMLLRLVQARL